MIMMVMIVMVLIVMVIMMKIIMGSIIVISCGTVSLIMMINDDKEGNGDQS